MRVGLNSGEVVVRAIGNDLHMDYSAVGETTHLAARMEQLATPGSIRLSAATLRLVEGLIQGTSLGPVPVKGLAEPVEVFELVGASPLRRRLQAAAARGLTPFVGRQPELAALHQALAQAQAGHGQVVALVGEAGVGKSRLVYEVVHSHRTQGWLVVESASVSYGKATPYFPVLDLLKRYCHVEDRDDSRTMRAKVTGQILTLDEGLQDTLPALLALLDVLPEVSFVKEQFNLPKWSSMAGFQGLSRQGLIQCAAFDPKGAADGRFAHAVCDRLPDRLHGFGTDGMRPSAPLASSFGRLQPGPDAFCGQGPFVLG
jgi:hypothetical protein